MLDLQKPPHRTPEVLDKDFPAGNMYSFGHGWFVKGGRCLFGLGLSCYDDASVIRSVRALMRARPGNVHVLIGVDFAIQ